MHKYDNSKHPSALNSQFVKPSNIYCYSTTSNQTHSYSSPKFRLVWLQKSFRYTGVKIWINFEKEVKLQTINKFYKNYNNHLFKNMTLNFRYLAHAATKIN